MAGDMDRAQDYTQETFIKAFEKLREFRGESALSTWLGSIAISITLNGLRKIRRALDREVSLDDGMTAGRIDRGAEPDLKERLSRAIDSLPDGYRTRTRRSQHPSEYTQAPPRLSCFEPELGCVRRSPTL
jgi:RNA polymerase sigma-70 factor (ECF subfamily)